MIGQLVRQVTPQQVGWFFNAELVAATVLGGARAFSGPIVGALVMVAIAGGLAEIGVRVWTRLRGRATADFVGCGERPWTRP